MSQTDLIKKLSYNLEPVQVKKFGLKNYFYALASGLFSISTVLAITGIRNDLEMISISPRFVFEIILLLTLAISSLIAAFSFGIPSLSKPKTSIFAIISLALWFVILVLYMVKLQNPIIGWGISCATEVALTSLLPALVLFIQIKSIYLINPFRVGLFVLLSSAAFGAIATQLSCPSGDPAHALVWHALPVILIGLLGFIVSNLILKKL